MQPTFNVPTNATVNPLQGNSTSLLPGEALAPVAEFSSEMQSFRAIPLTPSDTDESGGSGLPGDVGHPATQGAEIPSAGGERSPSGGKGLPVDLRVMLDEMRGIAMTDDGAVPGSEWRAVALQQAENPDAVSRSPADLPIYSGVDVRLPPGLRLTPGAATAYPLSASGSARDGKQALAPDSTLLDRQLSGPAERGAAIERLSQLLNVPTDKLQSFSEQRDVATADLKRIVDSLVRTQTASESAASHRARTGVPGTLSPVPAPTARIDGTILDGRSRGFRPLGVGQPVSTAQVSRTVVELDVDIPEIRSASHVRADVVSAEILRAESMAPPKPSSGGFQIAAPQIGPANMASNLQTAPLDSTARALPGSIDVPVRDTAWGDRLSERVVMMANNRLQNVDLRLTPAELGPLRVKVSVEDGAANVSFVAQHALTRDAIEQALPRLKTLLEQNGIDLGNTTVDQQTPDQGRANADADGAGSDSDDRALEARTGRRGDDPESNVGSATASMHRLSRGLLDTFA